MIKFAVCAIAFGDGMVHTYLHNTVLDTYSIGWVCVVTFRTLALALGEVVTYLQGGVITSCPPEASIPTAAHPPSTRPITYPMGECACPNASRYQAPHAHVV
mmetsp:Transcript_7873/g.14961  ORF Transcript_7873/g.14961 Transcript_7873/m.14961 type:complete len:102 (-) Transcript_7873:1416-1721(-)